MIEDELKTTATNNIPEGQVDINRYGSEDDLSSKKLEVGLWLLEHRKNLRLALIVFLVIIAAISWTYTIYGFSYYIAKGMGEDKILAEQLVSTGAINHDYISQLSPRDLIYSPAQILRSSDNKYDFVSEIKNPNQKHWGSFRYCLIEQGREFDCQDGFIFPGETKNLLSLANNFNYLPRDVNLAIKNLSWKRLSYAEIPDWNDFKNNHLNIEITNAKFEPSQTSGLSEKLNLNILEFEATNKTAYNYWEAPLAIFLYSGNSLIGVNKYILTEFMSKDKKSVEMSWSGNLGGTSSVKIIPDINILKDDIYIKYQGEAGQEK